MDGRRTLDDRCGPEGVRLRCVLADAEIVGADDVCVSHCTTDAAACRDGDLFVLLSDDKCAATDAVRLGAAAIVAARPLADCPVPVCYVPDAAEAYGRICQALAGRPSDRLKVIGVAGSYGKTTTGYLIASILSGAGQTPGVLSSLGYCDGLEVCDARWTTPPAPIMASWLRRMSENGCTHAVVEVSGRGALEWRTAGMSFDVLCLTNLRSDDDARGCTVDGRRYAQRLLDQLRPEGVLVVNADDACGAWAADRHDGPVLTVGLEHEAELTAVVLERFSSEQTFCLSLGDEAIPVRTTLPGDHNVLNSLLAAAVGSVYRLPPAALARGIESVRDLPGRLERIECGQPYTVFVDEARTPQALSTCLQALRGTTRSRLRCVLSAAELHDRTTRARFARVAEQWADETIVTQSPSSSATAELLDDVAAGFRRPSQQRIVADRADAIRQTLTSAEPGDCVLVAGQGSDTYQLPDREQDYWDDRQLVRQTLYSLDYSTAVRRAA